MSDTRSLKSSVHLELPAWIPDFLAQQPMTFPTQESRMELVISLARLNCDQGTGGPFGAAVFSTTTHTLIATGVNLVVPTNCSIAHAEIVALMLAQHRIGSHDLGASGLPAHELVASCEPCAMCLGAICWSGVRQLLCGARGSDAEAIGFDEGPKPPDWLSALTKRGITVTTDIARPQATQVLHHYVKQGGPIYNGRQRSLKPPG